MMRVRASVLLGVVGSLLSCGPKTVPAPAGGGGTVGLTTGSGSAADDDDDDDDDLDPNADPCADPCADPHAASAPPDPAAAKLPPEPELPTVDRPDSPPEVFPPPWKKVGVGQKVSFSVAAIDQDLDETAVLVTKLPPSATFDAITQTVTWTPTPADLPKAEFVLSISQPRRGRSELKTWTFAVDKKAQPMPVAPEQTAMIETLLMIRQAKRLEQVNKDWPLDKMLLVAAESFKYQIPEAARKKMTGKLDQRTLFDGFLAALAQTHNNPRLDAKSPKFEKDVFGDPAAWQIVAFRPRIDRAWTELRVVYRAVKAPEATFAMFRLRPTVEYIPPVPRPPQERIDNNTVFLGMVAKHLMVNGAPNPKFKKDQVAHGKAVAALLTELMAYDESAKAPHLRGFAIGIATEAQLGGGSARTGDGSYSHGDAWGWSAMKPFLTPDGKTQQWVNVVIPGFWTKVTPTADGKSWTAVCGNKYINGAPGHQKGYEVLCRKTMGFVDLPEPAPGKIVGGKVDSNHLYVEHKMKDMVRNIPLDDGRRDLGEENGMTCSQCHIRNFGMHDRTDLANVDPSQGLPKTRNKKIATLNFQIVPSTHWEEFTINFLHHQECRGKQRFTETLGPDAAKGFTCPLDPKPAKKK